MARGYFVVIGVRIGSVGTKEGGVLRNSSHLDRNFEGKSVALLFPSLNISQCSEV